MRKTWGGGDGEGWMKKLEELREGKEEEEIREGVDEEGMKRENNAAETEVQGYECVRAE